MSAPSDPWAVAATYYDGQSAKARAVHISTDPTNETLVITEPNGAVLATWTAVAVRLVNPEARGGETWLRCEAGGESRLVISAGRALKQIQTVCPNLRKGESTGRRTWIKVALWGTAAALAVVVIVTVFIPALSEQIANNFPPTIERKIGDATAEQIIRQAAPSRRSTPRYCSEPSGVAALQSLSDQLVAGLENPIEVTVRVVPSDFVNALALPGNQVLIFSKLINEAESGDEIVGVLAHEIAHLALRHPTEMIVKRATVSLLVGLLMGDVFGGSTIAGLGTFVLRAAYGREAETEADALGVRLLNDAGYTADGKIAFFERLVDEHGDIASTLGYFSTHPPSADRIEAIRAAADRGSAPLDAERWAALRNICTSTTPL
jgi:Zn-dependent protease with chaperone function